MNTIRLICLLVLTFAIASPAQSALDRVEETLELERSQVTLPRHKSGKVVVRLCSECDVLVLKTSARTFYQLGFRGEKVKLRDFNEAISRTHANDSLIAVSYDPETNKVNRIVLGTAPSSASAR